jgi:hypothetical protein
MADGGAQEPPERVAEEPDRHQDEQDLPAGLLRDLGQRPLLVGRLAAGAERQLEGEDADDRVDRAAGDEARAREPLEPARVRDRISGRLGLVHRGVPAALAFRWLMVIAPGVSF